MEKTNPEGLPWKLVRRCALLTDKTLLNDTKAWLAGLPDGVRPVLLPTEYPRIANELAPLWNETRLVLAKLVDFTADRRGHRQGFPPLIHDELERLLADVEQRSDAPPSNWF